MNQNATARHLAATIGSAPVAREWLIEAMANTPDRLAEQQALFAVSLSLEECLPGAALPGPAGEVERALVSDDWQTAYNAAIYTPLGGAALLARMLMVANGLCDAGAPEAALDVLNRALDAYAGEPAVYEALVPVLTLLGRHEDAATAAGIVGDAQLALAA
jgi:hypothetical protein